MFHTCAFTGNIALNSTKQAVNALADSIMRIGGSNGFVPQDDMMLVAAAQFGLSAANAKLFSPKLSQFNPFQITPLSAVASPTDGEIAAFYRYRPFIFRAQEEITAQIDNGNAAAQQETIILWLSTRPEQIPAGERMTVVATSITVATAFAWSTVAYTLNQALPQGTYLMIGSRCFSATGLAHRWTFWNQFYRPGMLSLAAQTNRPFDALRDLYLGAMGSFQNTTLPVCEVLCGAADASHTIIMDVIKVG